MKIAQWLNKEVALQHYYFNGSQQYMDKWDIKVVRHWTTSQSIYGVSINQQNLHNLEYWFLVEWLEL